MAGQLHELIGQRLTHVMDNQQKVTVPELVEALDAAGTQISERTIRRIRGGGTVSAADLVAMAEALGVTLPELLTDPASPDWRLLRGTVGLDATDPKLLRALFLLRRVDYEARRYRQAQDLYERAATSGEADEKAAEAREALRALDELRQEAEDEFGHAVELIPDDVTPAVEGFRGNGGRWYVGDPPDDQGRTSGTLGRGDQSIEWTDATESQVLRAITDDEEGTS